MKAREGRKRHSFRLCTSLTVILVLGFCTAAAQSAVSSSRSTGGRSLAAREDSVRPNLRKLLPASIRQSNTLNIATNIYPPLDFYAANGKTLTGFDYEIVQELAQRFGVHAAWKVIDFSALIPGINAGQYNFATVASDTKQREKVVDFVDEFQDGIAILVKKGNPEHIRSSADLCGKTVLLIQGSYFIPFAAAQSAKCRATGKASVKSLLIPGDPQALLAMKSGRADAYLTQRLTGSYALAKTANGKYFELVPGTY